MRAEEEKARKKALRPRTAWCPCEPTGWVGAGLTVLQKVQSGGRIELLIEFLGGAMTVKLKPDEVDLLEAA